MLDRLDEVFPRRSQEEENGLKGLLRAAYNLSEPELRIKVFLRDDIIEQLATSKEGFTALTHVTDRSSSTLTWAKEKILLLTYCKKSLFKWSPPGLKSGAPSRFKEIPVHPRVETRGFPIWDYGNYIGNVQIRVPRNHDVSVLVKKDGATGPCLHT